MESNSRPTASQKQQLPATIPSTEVRRCPTCARTVYWWPSLPSPIRSSDPVFRPLDGPLVMAGAAPLVAVDEQGRGVTGTAGSHTSTSNRSASCASRRVVVTQLVVHRSTLYRSEQPMAPGVQSAQAGASAGRTGPSKIETDQRPARPLVTPVFSAGGPCAAVRRGRASRRSGRTRTRRRRCHRSSASRAGATTGRRSRSGGRPAGAARPANGRAG